MNAPTIVIGAGIIGLSIAATLRKRGAPVLLLDAGAVCGGASWGNAGHIATEQVYPVADPSLLKKLPAMLLNPLGPLRLDWRYLPKLLPWAWHAVLNMRPQHFQKNHQALLALNSRCLADWQQFAREWRLAPWLQIQGSLLVCEQDATADALQKHGRTLNALGVENQWLSAEALHEREPGLAANQSGGLFYPHTGHIVNLDALTQTLKTAFTGMGGRLQEYCTVYQAHINADGGLTLLTGQGMMQAAKVVLAAGAFSKTLAQQLTGINVPLDTERGYHLMLPAEQGRLKIPVSSADRRFIMTPMTNGLRLAGTVEYAGLRAPPNMARARKLLPLAEGMLAQPLDADGASEWMGCRPTTADSLPVIDRSGNVLLAFGHQHLGLTQAATTAAAIAALYFDEPPPHDLRPFRLNRFAG
ncbi:FAD-binding oxidoreductase [Uruburuella testudinis]|uniref:FAD-binding oxidoreductase n=1 Tax=Uruburuella testudinis TaxID=1282863 RepID=A0ABY4DV38_9NEIS|nr:FAD-dependent oxidoreductase [Uruburuella testudinis]UOO82477.1 FAD-binding oxidoreductase [Uruburuella testudinis]